jgi:hypothetical protein
VLVASTGVIGVGLKMDRWSPGIQAAAAGTARGKGSDTAHAIMTTDPFPKEHAVRVQTPRGSFIVGGTAKGSGMIEPNMATMLGFLTTDASVLAGAAAARARGIGPAHLQRHHRRRRVFDQRLPVCAGSGQSGCDIDDDSYPPCSRACASVRELASASSAAARGRPS